MEKLNNARFLLPALFFLLLLFLPAEGQNSPHREFSQPAAVESGSGMLSPHAVSDLANRVNVALISQAAGQYARYAHSPFPGESYSRQTVQSVPAWNPRVSLEGDNRFVVFSYETGGVYYPRARRRTNGTFSTVFDGTDFANYEGASDVVSSDVKILNNNVHIIADTNITGGITGNWNVKVFTSSTGGAENSFSAPTQLSTTPNARYPALAASGANVYAAWVAGGHVRFARSTNSGGAWLPEMNISDPEGAASARPGIAAVGDWVFIVWAFNNNIWFSFSSNEGVSFSAPSQIAVSGVIQSEPSIGAAMTGAGPHLFAAWRHVEDNPRVFFQEALFAGTNFTWGIDLNADGNISFNEAGLMMRVSDAAPGDETAPSTAVSPGRVVYVVWRDSAAGIRSARYLPDAVLPFAPDPPSGLVAVSGDSQVTLNWTASPSSDVESYIIYRGTERGSLSQVGTTDSDTLTFIDEAVTNGTIYWYAVTAEDVEGRESVFSNDVNATPQPLGADMFPPAAPVNLRASPGDQTVTLRWNDNIEPDLDRYHVYSRTDSLSLYEFTGSVPAPGNQFFHHGLTDGVTYEYVVTAIDNSNNESDDSNSAWATPGTGDFGLGTPPAPAPDGAGPVPVGPGGGCFIATAAYGTGRHEELFALYGLRDGLLSESFAGRRLVSAYYGLSPAMADAVSGSGLLRAVVRLHLMPFVALFGFLN